MNRFTILLLASLSGCVVDGDEIVDESTAEQAVTGTAMQTHQCGTNQDECWLDLPAGQCVLAGITGGLGGGSLAQRMAKIQLVPGEGWKLHIKNGGGAIAPLVVKTVCVTGVTGGFPATWYSNNPPKVIPNGFGEHCFLTGITHGTTAFMTFDSYVQIKKVGTDSVVEGNLPNGVAVDVKCFDATQIGAFAYGNGSTSGVSGDLSSNQSRAGGVACGLTGLGGKIDFYNRGVMIEYNNYQWWWQMSGLTGGNALCFQ